MITTMNERLLAAAVELPVEERIELVEAIWDSISETEEPALTEAQRHELDRRLDDLDQNPGTSRPWEEVKARLQKAL